MNNVNLPLILGSQSPRRRQLLTQSGMYFRVITPKAEEKTPRKTSVSLRPAQIVKRISEEKAENILAELPPKIGKNCLLLTADTLVFLRNQVLGKPKNARDARRMLQSLSGKNHFVFTGVSLAWIKNGRVKKRKSIAVRTKVRFFRLSAKLISWYIATGEPMDKAGAYGAQDYGSLLVETYSGSYTNVVGLPVGQTLKLIEEVTGKPFHNWQK